MLILDKDLRDLDAGETKAFYSDIRRLARFHFSSMLYRLFISIAVSVKPKITAKQVICELTGFPALQQMVARFCAQHGLVHKQQRQSSGFRWYMDILSMKRVLLFHLVLGDPRATLFYKRLRDEGPEKVLRNDSLMSSLNKLVRSEIRFVAQIIKLFNIIEVMAQEDCSPSSAIICEAANICNVRFTVVAHGYLQGSNLVTICPIKADTLIVWTRNQLEDMRCVLEPIEARKLAYIGFPKMLPRMQKNDQHSVLFISDPLDALSKKPEFAGILRRILSEVKNVGFECVFRLHPKERHDQKLRRFVSDLGFTLTDQSLNLDLAQASHIVGSNSSVLVECAYNGFPTCQIAELRQFEFENVTEVAIDDLASFLSSDAAIGKSADYFDQAHSALEAELHQYLAQNPAISAHR